jgi:plasmid stability protein
MLASKQGDTMTAATTKRDVRAIIVRLEPADKRDLKIAAAEDGMSIEGIVRELIGQYLRERADERDLTAVK